MRSDSVVSDREEAAAEFTAAPVVFEGELLPGGDEISTWNGLTGLQINRALRSPSESQRHYPGDVSDRPARTWTTRMLTFSGLLVGALLLGRS